MNDDESVLKLMTSVAADVTVTPFTSLINGISCFAPLNVIRDVDFKSMGPAVDVIDTPAAPVTDTVPPTELITALPALAVIDTPVAPLTLACPSVYVNATLPPVAVMVAEPADEESVAEPAAVVATMFVPAAMFTAPATAFNDTLPADEAVS